MNKALPMWSRRAVVRFLPVEALLSQPPAESAAPHSVHSVQGTVPTVHSEHWLRANTGPRTTPPRRPDTVADAPAAPPAPVVHRSLSHWTPVLPRPLSPAPERWLCTFCTPLAVSDWLANRAQCSHGTAVMAVLCVLIAGGCCCCWRGSSRWWRLGG
jgi:hypothetical protein